MNGGNTEKYQFNKIQKRGKKKKNEDEQKIKTNRVEIIFKSINNLKMENRIKYKQ